jgi:enoyl-CoA hydratase/carnithine racemase
MSVSFSDMGQGVRLIRFSGQSATQSFSRTFLPEIAKAIDDGLTNTSVGAIVLTGDRRW